MSGADGGWMIGNRYLVTQLVGKGKMMSIVNS
jgi:hypothetical protein